MIKNDRHAANMSYISKRSVVLHMVLSHLISKKSFNVALLYATAIWLLQVKWHLPTKYLYIKVDPIVSNSVIF